MFARVEAVVFLVAMTVRCATSVVLDVASLGTVNHTLSPIEPKVVTSALQESHTLVPIEPKVVGPACGFPPASVSVPASGSVTFSSPSFFLPQLCGWLFTTVAGSTFTMQCQTFNLAGPDTLYVVVYQNLQTSTYPYTGQSFPSIVTLNAQTVGAVFLHNQLSSLGSFSCTITASGTNGPTTSAPPTNNCRCGIVNRAPRIVGGVNTQVNEYPWQVGVMYTGTRNLFCGGSLISNRYVVTSAYCMRGRTVSSFRLLLSGHTKDSPSATEKIVNPIRIITHPLYQVGNFFNNDIALIEIAPLDFNNPTVVARPVCLPNSDDPYAGVTATVTGWGTLYSGGPQPNILQEVDLTVVTNAYCTSVFGSYITSSMICAGTAAGGKDSCQRDSGSPLIAPDGANNELIGIVSFGAGCGIPSIPGVYSRVRALQSWIQSIIIGSTTCGR